MLMEGQANIVTALFDKPSHANNRIQTVLKLAWFISSAKRSGPVEITRPLRRSNLVWSTQVVPLVRLVSAVIHVLCLAR